MQTGKLKQNMYFTKIVPFKKYQQKQVNKQDNDTKMNYQYNITYI